LRGLQAFGFFAGDAAILDGKGEAQFGFDVETEFALDEGIDAAEASGLAEFGEGEFHELILKFSDYQIFKLGNLSFEMCVFRDSKIVVGLSDSDWPRPARARGCMVHKR
jgi:hypothetical protein